MKPYVIYFGGDFLGGPELHLDGKTIAQDTREAMRFDTDDEALAYIDKNRSALEKIGSYPRTIFTLPTGHTHH